MNSSPHSLLLFLLLLLCSTPQLPSLSGCTQRNGIVGKGTWVCRRRVLTQRRNILCALHSLFASVAFATTGSMLASAGLLRSERTTANSAKPRPHQRQSNGQWLKSRIQCEGGGRALDDFGPFESSPSVTCIVCVDGLFAAAVWPNNNWSGITVGTVSVSCRTLTRSLFNEAKCCEGMCGGWDDG